MSRGSTNGWSCGRGDVKKTRWRMRIGGREKRWAYYDKQNFRMYRQVITGGGAELGRAGGRRVAWVGEAGAGAVVRVTDAGGLVDVEPRRIAATGALQ